MEFFRPGLDIQWMKHKSVLFAVSSTLSVLGILGMIWPGPNWGTDFAGGTEIQILFEQNVDISKLRRTVSNLGHGEPEIVRVSGSQKRYIIRVRAVSPVPPAKARAAQRRLQRDLGATKIISFRLSPGGDKVSVELSAPADVDAIRESLRGGGLGVRTVQPFGRPEEHRYEAFLVGISDSILAGLRERLGERVVPPAPESAEWVGPKAGAQLRDAGIKSLLFAMLLMGIYIAFRFDLRFAPGALLAVVHDVAICLLAVVVLRVEVTLGTIAAVLTIIGYSINDTIVIYDRVRENLAKMRDSDLERTINVSINESLGRTVNTGLGTMLAVIAIIVFTTGNVRDFAITLFPGFLAGVYSTVFIASPVTIWIDRYLLRRPAG